MIEVLEVFNSISGEVTPWYQGCLTTFVRLGGCNLDCDYCDTPHDRSLATLYNEEDFIDLVNHNYQKTGRICITGGEPLLQMDACEAIMKNFRNVWIETNGTCDFSYLIGNVTLVTDYKLDEMRDIPTAFFRLKRTDFIKFVVGNKKDIGDAQKVQQAIQMCGCGCNFAYSPMHELLDAKLLLECLMKNPLPNTIINVQIHKYLEMK
jgi:7-carboxy-7-deazaguanine synthase